jgi:APA family basic amino acid/polyamine antiporter
VSWPAAAALVAGNMIGTGVFTSLGFQVIDFPGGFSIALLWVLGGVVALCGAACYAELGALFPRSGGEYHLLGQTWHPLAGFLAGWLSITVGFAAPVALACSAFGAYASGAFFGGHDTARLACALAVLGAATAVHLASIRVSGRFQLAATVVKVAALTGLAAAGWMATPTTGSSLLPSPGETTALTQPAFAVALFFVAYSYSGWNAAVYIAGELKNPARDLPKALLVGTSLVTVLYVLFNLALLRSTPVDQLRGQVDVGLVAARHLFGDSGGRAMGALIAAGLVSAVSAMMWAGPRVAATMGQDWRLFSPLARTSVTGVPWVATLWQALLAAGFLVAGGFQEVLTYTEFTLSLSTFLTVAGVVWLRWKQPDHHRPFRCWGYPVTPAVFLLATGYALIRFATSPDQWHKSWLGLATVAAGALVYRLAGHRGRNQP